jgi:hypothetical protein
MRILRPTNTSNISAVRTATLLKTEIHMARCEVLASQHAVIPPEVCYETLLLPYLSLRTESGAFRGALDRYFRSCGASLMMPWEGDEISLQSKYGLPNNLIVCLTGALNLLCKSLPHFAPSSTRVPGLPSHETISRSIILPFDLCLSWSG